MHQLELETRRQLLEGRLVQQVPQVDLTQDGVRGIDVDTTFVSQLNGCGCRQLLVVLVVAVVDVPDFRGRESGQRKKNLSHGLRTRFEVAQSRLVVNVDVWKQIQWLVIGSLNISRGPGANLVPPPQSVTWTIDVKNNESAEQLKDGAMNYTSNNSI